MKKEILSEVNRTREIMGLGVILEQEETKKVDYKKILDTPAYKDLIAAFQVTPANEREKLKQQILQSLKKAKIDGNIIRLLIQTMEGLKEEPEVPQEELDSITSGKKSVKEINEQFFLNTRKHRYGANSNRWGDWAFLNPGQKATRVVGGLITTLTGLRITHSNAYNILDVDFDIPIIKATEDVKHKLDSKVKAEPTIPMEEWQEFYEKWNPRFMKRIVKGKKLWEYAWKGTEAMNKKFLEKISQDKRGDDESTPDIDESGKSEAELWNDMKPFVISTLETFKDLKRRRKYKIRITTERELVDKIEGEEIVYPPVQLQFPLDGQPTGDFFTDNHYEPTQKFIDSYNEMEAALLEKSKEANPPEGAPRFWLSALDIKTSCSAIPNGKSPDNNVYSWEELAMKRAEAGRDYIIERLKKIGCIIGDNGSDEATKILLDAKGKNVGKKSKDGKDLTGTSGPVYGEDGSPEDKSNIEYEQSKFFIPTFQFLINTQEVQPAEETEDVLIYAPNLYVNMVKKGRGGWRPNIDFTIPGIRWNPLAGIFKFVKALGRLKPQKCNDFRRSFKTVMDQGM